MADEVGEGHLTRQEEGNRPGEQANQQQHAADELNHRSEPEQREDVWASYGSSHAWREAEKLLRAVFEKDERGDNAEYAEQAWRPFGSESLGLHSSSLCLHCAGA
nr:hypothetical protein [Belnapia sp. F-4-1]